MVGVNLTNSGLSAVVREHWTSRVKPGLDWENLWQGRLHFKMWLDDKERKDNGYGQSKKSKYLV